MAELFAGIGGWSEAARMAGGITPVWYSEIAKNKIPIYELRHPGVPNLGDIATISAAPYADIFTVSFPCTDISVAGKGAGIEGPNSRLWFEAERIIGMVRPRYVIIENSPIINIRGFHRILAAFARFGYDAEWTCLQGRAFDIQQERKRLFCVAYANKVRQSRSGEGAIFRNIEERWRGHTPCIYPGWASRSDIPEPRTYRSAYDIPGGVHRLECTGDAIIPLIGMYVLECVKRHAQE